MMPCLRGTHPGPFDAQWRGLGDKTKSDLFGRVLVNRGVIAVAVGQGIAGEFSY